MQDEHIRNIPMRKEKNMKSDSVLILRNNLYCRSMHWIRIQIHVCPDSDPAGGDEQLKTYTAENENFPMFSFRKNRHLLCHLRRTFKLQRSVQPSATMKPSSSWNMFLFISFLLSFRASPPRSGSALLIRIRFRARHWLKFVRNHFLTKILTSSAKSESENVDDKKIMWKKKCACTAGANHAAGWGVSGGGRTYMAPTVPRANRPCPQLLTTLSPQPRHR